MHPKDIILTNSKKIVMININPSPLLWTTSRNSSNNRMSVMMDGKNDTTAINLDKLPIKINTAVKRMTDNQKPRCFSKNLERHLISVCQVQISQESKVPRQIKDHAKVKAENRSERQADKKDTVQQINFKPIKPTAINSSMMSSKTPITIISFQLEIVVLN